MTLEPSLGEHQSFSMEGQTDRGPGTDALSLAWRSGQRADVAETPMVICPPSSSLGLWPSFVTPAHPRGFPFLVEHKIPVLFTME